jgi:hypothetical protein
MNTNSPNKRLLWPGLSLALIAAFTVSPAVTRAQSGQAQQSSERKLEKRARAYEGSCVLSLRALNVAQGTYRSGDEKKGFARTLRELGPAGAGILDASVVSGKKDGYRFRLQPEPTAPGQPVKRYTIISRPLKRLVKNQRSFRTDETGVIRFTTQNRPATNADPRITE